MSNNAFIDLYDYSENHLSINKEGVHIAATYQKTSLNLQIRPESKIYLGRLRGVQDLSWTSIINIRVLFLGRNTRQPSKSGPCCGIHRHEKPIRGFNAILV